jgi:hypothetical protein
MGYKVYLSNNLPSGVVSALAPSTIGGPSAAGSATTGHSMLFGKRGVIDLILQKAPAMELRKPDSKIGVNLITWTVYGAGVSTKNRGRARNVTVKSA